MKLLFPIALHLKKSSIIFRLLLLLFSIGIIFIEAIPDLKFNLNIGKTKIYTEKQILESKKESLPLYLKISDVEPIGEMYIEELRYSKKNKDTTLSAIVYPVYNIQNKTVINIEDLKNTPCNIVVRDTRIKKDSLNYYFNDKKLIEGKFDQTFIDDETKNLLIENGYNISDKCILIKKGVKFWSKTTCILCILFFGLSLILVIFSFLPYSVLTRTKQTFISL